MQVHLVFIVKESRLANKWEVSDFARIVAFRQQYLSYTESESFP
jgi:hypothetical protein